MQRKAVDGGMEDPPRFCLSFQAIKGEMSGSVPIYQNNSSEDDLSTISYLGEFIIWVNLL